MKNEEIAKLSEEVLSDFELDRLPLEKIIAKCKRLARLQDDFDAQKWLDLELNGYNDKSLPIGITKEDAERLAARSGRYYQIEMPVIQPSTTKSKLINQPNQIKSTDIKSEIQNWYYFQSVGELASEIETLKERLKSLVPPQSYSPAITKHESGASAYLPAHSNEYVQEKYVDVLKKINDDQSALSSRIKSTTALQSRIHSHIYNYVLGVYHKFKFSQIIQSIFEQCKKSVDTLLMSYCPEAVKELAAAYERLSSDEQEAWAQAMTSCRRFLKDFADAVYPASNTPYTDSEGIKLKVDDSAYKNRIWAFIDTNLTGSRKKLFKTRAEDMGNRINSINDLLCKGVHAELTQNDVNMCVIDTYLIIGSLLQEIPIKNTKSNK